MCSGFGNVEAKNSFDKILNRVLSEENEAQKVQTGCVNNVFNDFSVRGSNEMARARGDFQDACVLMRRPTCRGRFHNAGEGNGWQGEKVWNLYQVPEAVATHHKLSRLSLEMYCLTVLSPSQGISRAMSL